ncbi:MAG: cytochrome [Gaiellaceae bacterium]|jgi:mono/diheme cytochrome c family protein|nr:cytochrome [Gaiellaceae bacterium]
MSSRPSTRLVLVPLVLFLAFSGTAFALAQLHPAKPGQPKVAGGNIALGDAYNGETVFQQSCASCHGAGGKGGGVGPPLAGAQISVAAARAQIENGGSVMPGGLVKGQDERDVLAYLASILAGS